MRRVVVAVIVASVLLSFPFVLTRWQSVEKIAVVPIVPGFAACLLLTDAAGIDYFDDSGDFDATGLAIILVVSFIFWFVSSLLVIDIVTALRKYRERRSLVSDMRAP